MPSLTEAAADPAGHGYHDKPLEPKYQGITLKDKKICGYRLESAKESSKRGTIKITQGGVNRDNMKELRLDAADGISRFAFAFDPQRRAIILCGGDKSGVSEKLLPPTDRQS
jgi:hypothetical protein